MASTSGIHRITASDDVTPGTADISDIRHHTTTTVAATPYLRQSRNPSLAPNMGHASLGDAASGTLPPMALGMYTGPRDELRARSSERPLSIHPGVGMLRLIQDFQKLL